MKSKKSLLVLIPTVLGIWGYIIFSFFYTPTTEMDEYKVQSVSNSVNESSVEEDYQVSLNYRDPFLKTSNQPVVKTSTNPKVVKPTRKIKKKEIEWPKLSYKGYIQGENNNLIALINMGNDNLIMEVNSVISDKFILSEIHGDSILLSFETNSKYYYRN